MQPDITLPAPHWGALAVMPLSGGLPTPEPPRVHCYLPFRQARNLINALAYAASIGQAPTLHITLAWRQSAMFDPQPRASVHLQGRVLDTLTRWLRAKGQNATLAWVREAGSRYGEHTHLLACVPPEHRDELHALLLRAGRFLPIGEDGNEAVRITPNPSLRACMDSPNQWAGVLRYWLKTMSSRAWLNGEPAMSALGVDDRQRRPCTIHGKRSGVSHTLGPVARKAAGWRELVTVDELRAVLHPTEGLRHAA